MKKFSKDELEELAVEPNWLVRYAKTTAKMVEPFVEKKKKKQAFTGQSKAAGGAGIIIKGEMVTNAESV